MQAGGPDGRRIGRLKRIIYVNYPEIYLNTARIPYLGDLPAPTVQYFEAP